MLTKNNWLQTNIKKRVQERQLPLEVTLTPDIISSTDFNSAVDTVLTELLQLSSTEKFYLGFSGGADSDFVFYKLVEWGIPFEPIICFYGGNSTEYQYALHTCKKFGITPYIHNLSEKQFIQIFMQKVKPWGGDGLYSLPSMVLAEYAKNRDAKLLTGQDFITGSHDHCAMGFNVYDFYADVDDESIEIPFFLYNTDIVYHSVKRFDPNISVGEWKYELFEILDFRPKIEFHHLSRECWEALKQYFSYIATHFNNEGIDVVSKEKILRALENTGEKIILNANHTY
jgi:hypothetical protein